MTYKLIEQHPLADIQSEGIVYEHEGTGAKILFLQNEDTNKAFTIGFKTPPTSDNGITHIIEHSVLNGSAKYPSKEPFVELLKGSLSTFLNAMTYPDMTVYPVASTNQKDFENLVSVYLDAVFAPNFLKNPQILAQEGWHYHLESADANLIYKGVVFNEMKGANASGDRQLADLTSRYLFKGSPYQWNSGGDANAIPNLTQEEFIAYHQTYYHPSNSLTVVYGNVEVKQVLTMLAEYFDRYEKKDVGVDFTTKKLTTMPPVIQETYSLTEGDEAKEKDFLGMTWYVNTPDETIDGFGFAILQEILLGNNEAPLKKALLDAGIGGDISGGYQDLGYPRIFEVIAKFSEADRMDRFREVVNTTLTKIVEEGLDPELVQATMNKVFFRLKEMVISESSPRGVIYALEVLHTWSYGVSPFVSLEFSKYLNKIKDIANQGYFEKLIQHKLLANEAKVEVILTGQAGKNDQLEAEKLAQLQEYKASLSQGEIEDLVNQTQTLIERQNQPDTPEDLAKIPNLVPSDLTTETEVLPLDKHVLFEGTTFYHASQFTSGIDYLKFFVDLSDIPLAEFAWFKLLSSLLGKVDTQAYTSGQLLTQIDLHTGGIHGSVTTYTSKEEVIRPYFVLSGKALEEESDTLVALMKEILYYSQLTDVPAILKLVHRAIANFEQEINYSAHILASNRALSHISPSANLAEQYDGIDYFNFLKDIRRQLQGEEADTVLAHLQETLATVLTKVRFHALYIGGQKHVTSYLEAIQAAFSDLATTPMGTKAHYQAAGHKDEAFVTSQDVNYVALASPTKGYLDETGSHAVLGNILRYAYLWNTIRVKGGAYGALFSYKLSGYVTFASYRDPNIDLSLDTYVSTPEFIDSLDLSQEELGKSIIGTMSNIVRPLSAYDKGMKAFSMDQTGYTAARELRLKEEILSTNLADIKALKEKYEEVLTNFSIAVIGNKAQIDQDADNFDVILELY